MTMVGPGSVVVESESNGSPEGRPEGRKGRERRERSGGEWEVREEFRRPL